MHGVRGMEHHGHFWWTQREWGPVSFVTARGHSPETIKAGVGILSDRSFLPQEQKYLSIYPVLHDKTRQELGDNTFALVPALGRSSGRFSIWLRARSKQCNCFSFTVRVARLDKWNGGLLGSVASRSRPAARTCAGLEGTWRVPMHHNSRHHPRPPLRQPRHYGSSCHRSARHFDSDIVWFIGRPLMMLEAGASLPSRSLYDTISLRDGSFSP